MINLKCIITDDEPIAQEILEDYIKMVPGLQLAAKCNDAMETLAALRTQDVDVLFLDVQMPEINGPELVRSLKKTPMIVFTTAYPNYALEGYELDAVDYLLKPISLDRFLKTVDKLFSRAAGSKPDASLPANTTSQTDDKKYFFIKTTNGYARIEFNKILYIEGLENYIKIICEDKTLISLNTIKYIESVLPQQNFLRIHRSYIINLDKVDMLHENSFKIKNQSIAVGKSYRKVITEFIKTQFANR